MKSYLIILLLCWRLVGFSQVDKVGYLVSNDTVSSNIKVYPNPTMDGKVTLYIGREYKSFKFDLYDINGKIIETREITDKMIKLDLFSSDSSLYILKIMRGKEVIRNFKIIKQ